MPHNHGKEAFTIDKVATPPRTTPPVQVLVLGLSRTGTFSALAFEVGGFTCVLMLLPSNDQGAGKAGLQIVSHERSFRQLQEESYGILARGIDQ